MKRAKFITVIPTWEDTSSLNPYIKAHNRSDISWLMLEGKPTEPHMVAMGEEVSLDVYIPFDIQTLPFRDPSTFVAGNLHNHLSQWQNNIGHNDWNSEILNWIKHGVDITKYQIFSQV